MLTADQAEFRANVRAFAQEVIAPRRLEAYENPAFLTEMNRLVAGAGLFRTIVPKSDGGEALGMMGGVLLVEELARECPAVAIGTMCQMGLGRGMLTSPLLRDRWADGVLTGDITVAVASSDPVGIANYAEQPEIAVRDGDDYVLNGERLFVTQGSFADVIAIIGLFDGDQRSFWIEARQDGVEISPMPKMGVGAAWGRIVMTDVRVPAELSVDRSFVVENRRLIGINSDVAAASPHFVAAMSLGIAESVYEKTEAYLRERTTGGKPLAGMQALQFKLARMRQRIEAGRSLLYDAAQLVDGGRTDSVLDRFAKTYLSETAVDIARECVTLHGGRGYLRSAGVEVYLRDAIGCLVAEGTTEMHYSTIASLMAMPGAEPGIF